MCSANLNKPTKVELELDSSFLPFPLSLHPFPASALTLFSKLLDTLGVVLSVDFCRQFVPPKPPSRLTRPFCSFQQAAQIRVTRRHLARCAGAENVGECTAAGGIFFFFRFFSLFCSPPAAPFSIILSVRALTCATHCRKI